MRCRQENPTSVAFVHKFPDGLGVVLFGGYDSIRDFIAFPKNNSGRDVMSGSPSPIADAQLDELQIKVDLK